MKLLRLYSISVKKQLTWLSQFYKSSSISMNDELRSSLYFVPSLLIRWEAMFFRYEALSLACTTVSPRIG